MNNCKNCNSELNGNYCSNCGHPAKLKRIDLNYIKNEIGNLFYLEKGFLYTIKEIVIRPEKSIKEFISESRYRLVKPVTFLLLISLIYTLINYYFHLGDHYANEIIGEDATSIKVYKWIEGNLGYLYLIMGFFVAFWIKIFFKKYGYNYFEILILFCFLTGIELLINSLFAIIEGITKIQLVYIASAVGFVYKIWATGRFFANKPISYFKSFCASVLGILVFFIILTIIVSIILLIMQ
jgi:Protein of unknown function (DUF3667).